MFIFKSKKNKDDKDVLFKSIFKASSHAKIIRRSANKSSEVQARLIDKYNKLIA